MKDKISLFNDTIKNLTCRENEENNPIAKFEKILNDAEKLFNEKIKISKQVKDYPIKDMIETFFSILEMKVSSLDSSNELDQFKKLIQNKNYELMDLIQESLNKKNSTVSFNQILRRKDF